jgi:hypothetical protein
MVPFATPSEAGPPTHPKTFSGPPAHVETPRYTPKWPGPHPHWKILTRLGVASRFYGMRMWSWHPDRGSRMPREIAPTPRSQGAMFRPQQLKRPPGSQMSPLGSRFPSRDRFRQHHWTLPDIASWLAVLQRGRCPISRAGDHDRPRARAAHVLGRIRTHVSVCARDSDSTTRSGASMLLGPPRPPLERGCSLERPLPSPNEANGATGRYCLGKRDPRLRNRFQVCTSPSLASCRRSPLSPGIQCLLLPNHLPHGHSRNITTHHLLQVICPPFCTHLSTLRNCPW